MKYIELVIPTRGRLYKLSRTLHSIPPRAEDVEIRIVLVIDGDPETASAFSREPRVSRLIHVREHSGSVFCRNLASQTAEDALLYGTDDIEFVVGSIASAIRSHRRLYPNGDGLIGFTQINSPGFSMAGVGLMDQDFLRRLPDRKLLCPEYYHFSCQELERLGCSLNKIYLDPEAKLIHHHPSYGGEADKTHREARLFRNHDRKISNRRREEGLIWGLN